MRKEILIAVFGGLIIGLIIAFGSWRINRVVKEKTSPITNQTENNGAELIQKDHQDTPNINKITYANIEDFDVLTETPYKLSGLTKQATFVVISGESKDIVLPASPNGSFKYDIDLISGVNQILSHVFDPEGNEIVASKNIVVYSKELASLNEDPSVETGTASAGSTMDIVREKVDSIRKNPKALIGTVTDKTENSLQVKNLDGKIELISVLSETTFARQDKNATFADVAIGDYLAVLGYANGTAVHEAKRIVLINPLVDPTRKVVSGEVVSVNKKELVIKDAKETETTITFPKKWVGPEVKNIQSEMKALVIYTIDGGKPTLRTIQIIQPTNDSAQ